MPLRTVPLPDPLPPAPLKLGRAGLRLLIAASAVAMLAAWGAYAQQTGGLRGAVAAGDAAAADEAAIPTGAVKALSAASSAAADDEEADRDARPSAKEESNGLFTDPIDGSAQDDIFADPEPAQSRSPSTRKAREAAAEDAAQPQQPVKPRDAKAADEDGALLDPDAPASAANARIGRETVEPDAEALEASRALRVAPVEALPRTDTAETDPFAPVGLRVGTFILRPSVETGLTASSNASRTPEGSSGVLAETTLRLDAQSDWSEHSASLLGVGRFRKSVSGDDDVEEVEGTLDANLLFDLGHDWRARAGASYSVEPEAPADRDAVEGAEEQPIDQTIEGGIGLEKDLGPLRLAGTASVERDLYGEAELASGGEIDQSSRDSTLGLVTLRTGYALSPALTPFVEVEAGRRLYDETGDRTATRLGARAGVALDLREKLSGELSAGWLREEFDSDAFEPIGGPSLNASLKWSPVRGTVVGLRATTTVEGTTTENESGSLIHDLRLDVERTLRANLTAEAAFGASLRDYVGVDGRDLTLIGEFGATWWLNRNLGLSGRFRHERLDSDLPGREYRENSIFVGTKLQY